MKTELKIPIKMFANKISEVILSLSKTWSSEIGAASTNFRSCEVGNRVRKDQDQMDLMCLHGKIIYLVAISAIINTNMKKCSCHNMTEKII